LTLGGKAGIRPVKGLKHPLSVHALVLWWRFPCCLAAKRILKIVHLGPPWKRFSRRALGPPSTKAGCLARLCPGCLPLLKPWGPWLGLAAGLSPMGPEAALCPLRLLGGGVSWSLVGGGFPARLEGLGPGACLRAMGSLKPSPPKGSRGPAGRHPASGLALPPRCRDSVASFGRQGCFLLAFWIPFGGVRLIPPPLVLCLGPRCVGDKGPGCHGWRVFQRKALRPGFP
jgi:hypothetical protein